MAKQVTQTIFIALGDMNCIFRVTLFLSLPKDSVLRIATFAMRDTFTLKPFRLLGAGVGAVREPFRLLGAVREPPLQGGGIGRVPTPNSKDWLCCLVQIEPRE